MKLLFIMMAAVGLSACTISADVPNRMTIDSDGKITVDGDHKHGKRKHCPPGQAKKGHC